MATEDSEVGEAGRTRHSRGRRQRIREAAAQVFGRYGLSKTTMEEVAKAAGISRATLYNYYRDKEHLFLDNVRYFLDLYLEKLRAAMPACGSATARLEAYIRERIEFMSDARARFGMARAIWEELIPLTMEPRRKFTQTELALLTEIIEDGMAHGEFIRLDARVLAVVFLSCLQGTEIAFLSFGDEEQFEACVAALVSLLTEGMRSRKG